MNSIATSNVIALNAHPFTIHFQFQVSTLRLAFWFKCGSYWSFLRTNCFLYGYNTDFIKEVILEEIIIYDTQSVVSAILSLIIIMITTIANKNRWCNVLIKHRSWHRKETHYAVQHECTARELQATAETLGGHQCRRPFPQKLLAIVMSRVKVEFEHALPLVSTGEISKVNEMTQSKRSFFSSYFFPLQRSA